MRGRERSPRRAVGSDRQPRSLTASLPAAGDVGCAGCHAPPRHQRTCSHWPPPPPPPPVAPPCLAASTRPVTVPPNPQHPGRPRLGFGCRRVPHGRRLGRPARGTGARRASAACTQSINGHPPPPTSVPCAAPRPSPSLTVENATHVPDALEQRPEEAGEDAAEVAEAEVGQLPPPSGPHCQHDGRQLQPGQMCACWRTVHALPQARRPNTREESTAAAAAAAAQHAADHANSKQMQAHRSMSVSPQRPPRPLPHQRGKSRSLPVCAISAP
jgi:hypothetical protein